MNTTKVDTLQKVAGLSEAEIADLQSRLATLSPEKGENVVKGLSKSSIISVVSEDHDRVHDTHDRVIEH